ncbi:MAG: hypothetical protein WCL14_11505 [Bacteroidota bacterium]
MKNLSCQIALKRSPDGIPKKDTMAILKESRRLQRKTDATAKKVENVKIHEELQKRTAVTVKSEPSKNSVPRAALLIIVATLFASGNGNPIKIPADVKKLGRGKKGITFRLASLLSRVTYYLRESIVCEEPHKYDLYNGFLQTRFLSSLKRKSAKADAPHYFILMGLPNPGQIITAVLKLPKGFAQRGVTAKAIINACSGNAFIVVLPATITAMLLAMTVYDAKQTATKTRAIGTASARNDQWVIVHNYLKSLMAVAQAAAAASPATAITIIESGLFHVKMLPETLVRLFTAANTGTSGTVLLSAAGAARISLHIWEKSIDGIVWVPIDKTRGRKLLVSGLVPVSKVWFRHRTDTDGILSTWEYFYLIVN